MAEEFGPDWADAAGGMWSRLPDAPGADGQVSLAVATGPRREVTIHWRYEAGRVVAGGPGPGDLEGGPASLALTLAAADAAEVLSGRVEPSVAFMRGRLKAAGDGALMLAFLSSTTSDRFSEWLAEAKPAGTG